MSPPVGRLRAVDRLQPEDGQRQKVEVLVGDEVVCELLATEVTWTMRPGDVPAMCVTTIADRVEAEGRGEERRLRRRVVGYRCEGCGSADEYPWVGVAAERESIVCTGCERLTIHVRDDWPGRRRLFDHPAIEDGS